MRSRAACSWGTRRPGAARGERRQTARLLDGDRRRSPDGERSARALQHDRPFSTTDGGREAAPSTRLRRQSGHLCNEESHCLVIREAGDLQSIPLRCQSRGLLQESGVRRRSRQFALAVAVHGRWPQASHCLNDRRGDRAPRHFSGCGVYEALNLGRNTLAFLHAEAPLHFRRELLPDVILQRCACARGGGNVLRRRRFACSAG